MRNIIYLIALVSTIKVAFAQDVNLMKAFEAKHEALAYMSDIIILNAGMDKRYYIFCGTTENMTYYSDAGSFGLCESDMYSSSAIVKINQNLTYALTVGWVRGLQNDEMKVILSSISDGEATILINGLYKKERFKAGVNKYYESIRINSLSKEDSFSLLIRDRTVLEAFTLPNIISKENDNELMIFMLSDYFLMCIE